jgi:hypothetical protein
MSIAKRKWKRDGGIHILNLIENGNQTLDIALSTFVGSSAKEFTLHVERLVEKRMDRMIVLVTQHPGAFSLKWKSDSDFGAK